MAQTIQQLIKNRIQTKLLALTDDGGQTVIQQVLQYPTLEFTGFPASTITPIGIEADTSSNSNDLRRYKFRIRLFFEIPRDRSGSIGQAVDALYDCADRVMNEFTKDKQWTSPTSFQSELPTGQIFTGCSPVVGEWSQEGESKLIYVDIELTTSFLIPTYNCP